ncbi:MAG: hypothetical protein ACOYN0_02990, partial [Phycisphaerales bacterium]
MEQTESGFMLAWFALGEAAPVAALAIICLLSAASVAVVLGGLSAIGPDTGWISRIPEQVRSVAALVAAACGAASLGLMLNTMDINGIDWYIPVGMFCTSMVGFIAAQFALAPRPALATAGQS